MARVHEKLGFWLLPKELEDVGLEKKPQFDPYKYKTQNKQTFSQLAEELESTPGVGDPYLGADIFLSRGDQMARDHVVTRSHDANGNGMDRVHANPILDTRMYHIECDGGKVTGFWLPKKAKTLLRWVIIQCMISVQIWNPMQHPTSKQSLVTS